ncbi:C2 calcium/lipid-binding and GRAM domain containing protein [Artemisia annua]|uniref:C2 calcium/lipid-binding and GRAM domain containing protein n=1 Tax=Artemisia annua TaxID=35608 RepID=A0A2U1KN69_ARTAN|nr:C2 calcium/lipid-binding and GRAM domain containing protein [Artemisia annua]
MRLYVYVLEGKDWLVSQSFIKLKVGKSKFRTRVLKDTKNPKWNEEFAFKVDCVDDDELVVSVYSYDDEYVGFFNNGVKVLVGRVRIPLWSVAAEENHHLEPTWFSVENYKSSKTIKKECGKILLALSLHERTQDVSNSHQSLQPSINEHYIDEYQRKQSPSHNSNTSKPPKKIIKSITKRVEKIFRKHDDSSIKDDSSELPTTSSDNGESTEEPDFTTSFEDLLETMDSIADQKEMPENLQGGVLIDETYLVPPKDLNILLFGPDSQFRKDLADIEGSTDLHEGPWTWESGQSSSLIRTVTYTKAASKLVKASKVTEEQTYVRANEKEFAVFVSVVTPDVPYGGTFRVELLYKIMPGPDSDGEETSRIIVSWGINFHQSTMMKHMIESGAKQGLKESFDQFAGLLGQRFKPVNQLSILDKSQTLATLENEHQSDWELAVGYFCNFTVVSTVFMVLYVFVHILLCEPSRIQGLEFEGLELPDSFGEFIMCGIVFFNLERVYMMVSHFVQARLRRGNDHGVKAQGEGWVVTVAIIEATNLAALESSGFSDPYVVLTCNGKTRTSSVKLRTLEPQWNEILEFDAAEEPPSLLDVEVFDFDGPFGQAASLGHAEIRFLRHTSEELADMWVTLEGKLAQSLQSKLHLRIFLDNNNGVETIKEYLTKVEKEAGKKLNVKSPHRNSMFQKLFSLPPEEFLISDFSCSLKRKMPLQGRLFVSSRIVGFYANLFGHKTKFSFLWEDVEDIQVLPPSFASVGSPILIMILHKGRGVDARHGAKSQDEEGRLHFCFHSFVSFNSASRTIMALWKTRSPGSDKKSDTDEDKTDTFQDQQEEDERLSCEDGASHLVIEDARMSKIYSEELPLNVESMMKIFDGGNFEHKVMEKLCCLNYNTTTWEPVSGRPNVLERRLSYKFNRRVSSFGGDVTCTQQKTPVSYGKGWVVTEAMTLHDVPFGDHFYVQIKYEVVDCRSGWCACDVFVGVVWLKSCKFEQRITRNVIAKFSDRIRDMLELVERETLLETDGRS